MLELQNLSRVHSSHTRQISPRSQGYALVSSMKKRLQCVIGHGGGCAKCGYQRGTLRAHFARASKSRNVDTTRPDASVPCMPYPSICAINISAIFQNHIGTSVLNTTFGKLARTFQMLAWYQDSGSQRASVTGKNLPGKHGEISLVMYSISANIHHLFLRNGSCGPWEALQMRWRRCIARPMLWSLPPCDASASPLHAH
jgi:hypothetical protein